MERVFGVLLKIFGVLFKPGCLWFSKEMGSVVIACIQMHNMTVQDRSVRRRTKLTVTEAKQ